MKVLLFVACVIAFASAQCLDTTMPKNINMTFCTMYSGATCCSQSTDQKTAYLWQNSVVPRFGSDGCAQNIKLQMCAAACDPQQGLLATATFSGNFVYINETFYVSQYWADGLYASCKSRCISGVQTVQQLFPTSAAFVASFNTFNYPEYNDTVNVITTVGANPNTGGSFNETAGDASGNDTVPCPAQCLNPSSPYAIPRTMSFCTNYASGSCCNSTQEGSLQLNYNTKVAQLFGNDGCAQNIKTLYCFWACGPNQAKVSSLARGSPADNQTVYVDATFAQKLYDSCKNRCFDQAGVTWAQYFSGAGSNAAFAFISQFNSDNDKTYVPDNRGNPRITYKLGYNPVTNSAVNSTVVSGSGADLTGCKKGTTTGSNALTLAPFLMAIVALIAALL